MRISILSSDVLFARMLQLEIEAMRKNHEVTLNEYDFKSDDGRIIVLDLDSQYANGTFENEKIIGFSKNEGSVDSKNMKKCAILMHRPFLISKFLDQIELLSNNEAPQIKEDNESKEEARLCFLQDGLVTLDGRGVRLSENEYALLLKLYENINMSVSRDELGEALSSAQGNICDVYICKLRSKLEAGGSERLIYTVRSKGYMLKI